jgi:hypothetical protein
LNRLIHFFSLAVMTQVILMLSQLILLPIQVRVWGQTETALWYSALAVATMTYFVDCGLRTAGHAELMKAQSDIAAFSDERLQFQRIWSWIRVLILLVTGLLIAGDFVASLFSKTGVYAPWHAVLIAACATETMLVIRITYLDSLGRYTGAEASYFCFAVLRLALSIPGLVIFHWRAPGLAVIYLITAAIALLFQGFWLCRHTPLLQLTDSFTSLSWQALALARHTVAEPIANWARLSLPVLVIGQIAAPMAVTTYVALRAVFGAGRTTVQQLARVASVEVLKARAGLQPKRADVMLSVFIAVAICFGSTVGLFVIIDNLRLTGLWLKNFDRSLFQEVALAFALTAPFFSYQIPMNVMFRTGELGRVARRHYGFICCSLVFGGVSLFAGFLPLYLALLVTAEMLLSGSFFLGSRTGVSALRLAGFACVILAVFWMITRQNLGGWFVGQMSGQIAVSSLLFSGLTLAMVSSLYVVFRSDILLLRHSSEALIQ